MVKFGKDLGSNKKEEWGDHYLRYHEMKRCLDRGPGDEVLADFEKLYEDSLDTVNTFFDEKITEYDTALTKFEQAAERSDKGEYVPEERTFFHTFKEVTDLQTYIWLNATGFRKIAKKFDKRMNLRGTGSETQPEMEARLVKEPFMCSGRLEALLARSKAAGHTSQGGRSNGLKLIGGSGNRELAEEISGRLGIPLLKSEIKRFNDGEVCIKLHENVRGDDVYVIQPTCYPVNDNLMELLLTISALKRASVHYVIAVVPYYGYARMDRKAGSRVPISAADVARMMEAMGVDLSLIHISEPTRPY
eukprot:TRINITY_DN2580_c0_g1_i4.p1 TRINITY_DN2580_c0_g1~~TRINITY_DN2580_c0_g1_i4.p1  ORF type:complete len:304 (-),score=79.16 TRINITY_DN2580_c0_g1_i4:45-956(-)